MIFLANTAVSTSGKILIPRGTNTKSFAAQVLQMTQMRFKTMTEILLLFLCSGLVLVYKCIICLLLYMALNEAFLFEELE